MKRALSLIVMVTALLALAGPSLSRGLDGVWISTGSAVVAQDAGDVQAGLWGCKQLGGKRLMPCHPDLGVLAPSLRALIHRQGGVLPTHAEPLGLAPSPETELPPPRLG